MDDCDHQESTVGASVGGTAQALWVRYREILISERKISTVLVVFTLLGFYQATTKTNICPVPQMVIGTAC